MPTGPPPDQPPQSPDLPSNRPTLGRPVGEAEESPPGALPLVVPGTPLGSGGACGPGVGATRTALPAPLGSVVAVTVGGARAPPVPPRLGGMGVDVAPASPMPPCTNAL